MEALKDQTILQGLLVKATNHLSVSFKSNKTTFSFSKKLTSYLLYRVSSINFSLGGF